MVLGIKNHNAAKVSAAEAARPLYSALMMRSPESRTNHEPTMLANTATAPIISGKKINDGATKAPKSMVATMVAA